MPFVEKNVEEDDAAYKELLARGFMSVPVTIVGREAIRGYDPPALMAALERWRQDR